MEDLLIKGAKVGRGGEARNAKEERTEFGRSDIRPLGRKL
jgi:hypothetical protein